MDQTADKSTITAKILVIGDSNVGKTSLLARFTDNYFIESKIATVGLDLRTKILKIENKDIKLQLWDTAGQERYRAMTQNFYRGSMGFIIVFSLADVRSFENARKWIDLINDDCSDACKIVIGNKCDLVGDGTDALLPSYISNEEIERFIKEYNVDYFPTSTKTGLNVEKAFLHLARMIKEKHIPSEKVYNDENINQKTINRMYNNDTQSIVLSNPSVVNANNKVDKNGCC